MKILIINGSPRLNGNSSVLAKEIIDVFNKYKVESELIQIGNKNIRGCLACDYCSTHNKCVVEDEVNIVANKFKEADGLIIISPVYYGSPNGTLISFLDRLFYSTNYSKHMKVGAAFVIARRGGTTASFDVLNKYFTISGMPVVSGDYWNNGFGRNKGEINEDKEGLRNARVVAKRMVFLIKAIKEAKEKYPDLLQDEKGISTDFVKKN